MASTYPTVPRSGLELNQMDNGSQITLRIAD